MTEKSKNSGKSYELLVVLAGTLNESEIKKQLEKWESEIGKIGKILNKAVWGNRALAYKIKKEKRGIYLVMNFEAEGKEIAELDNALRLSTKVIRHLLYLTPKNYEWAEYSEEDLEHDFTKLKVEVDEKEEKKFVKRKPAPVARKTVSDLSTDKAAPAPKVATKKIEKKVEPKANVGEIDKKLDDILADL